MILLGESMANRIARRGDSRARRALANYTAGIPCEFTWPEMIHLVDLASE